MRSGVSGCPGFPGFACAHQKTRVTPRPRWRPLLYRKARRSPAGRQPPGGTQSKKHGRNSTHRAPSVRKPLRARMSSGGTSENAVADASEKKYTFGPPRPNKWVSGVFFFGWKGRRGPKCRRRIFLARARLPGRVSGRRGRRVFFRAKRSWTSGQGDTGAAPYLQQWFLFCLVNGAIVCHNGLIGSMPTRTQPMTTPAAAVSLRTRRHGSPCARLLPTPS